MVANRGEIATRVFRALTELHKTSVAIFTEQVCIFFQFLKLFHCRTSIPIIDTKQTRPTWLEKVAFIVF